MKHTPFKCPSNCENPYCNYCVGGLVTCTVCGGSESELTTDCCGYPLLTEAALLGFPLVRLITPLKKVGSIPKKIAKVKIYSKRLKYVAQRTQSLKKHSKS